MSSNQGDKLTKSKVLVFFNTYKLHNCMKVEHSRHSVYYSETISYNYEMKWIRYNKKTTSYNYEMKFIRFYIFMKEFIALLKNEILPSLLKNAASHSCCQPSGNLPHWIQEYVHKYHTPARGPLALGQC